MWPTQNTDSPVSRLEEEVEEKPITLVSQTDERECCILYQSDNLPKILRLTVFWLRVKDRLLGKSTYSTLPPAVKEIERALRSLIRWAQNVFFKDVVKEIYADKPAPARVRKLSPFLDEEMLLRVDSRLEYSHMPYEEEHPILLPKYSRLTELLINFIHRDKGHPGAQTTHNLLC